MSHYLPKVIEDAIEAMASLPGIGSRSAERLVFSLLKNNTGLEKKISESLAVLKDNIQECAQCHHYCEGDLCAICKSSTRDHSTLCIVSDSTDLVALEKTHEYQGLYHVLHGVISPVNKVKPEDLRINTLFERLDGIKEIILALSGDMESEATSLYLYDQLKSKFNGQITRLSRGIPSSSHLEYLDVGTLTRAMNERREF